VGKIIDEHVLAKMIETSDIRGLSEVFQKAENWDTREWAVVALGHICRDKRAEIDYDKLEMIKTLKDIVEVCEAERTGGTYRTACLENARMFLEGLREKLSPTTEERSTSANEPISSSDVGTVESGKVELEEKLPELATKAYINEKLRFSIIPPKSWSIVEFPSRLVSILGSSVIFYAPTDGEKSAELEKLNNVEHIELGAIEEILDSLCYVPSVRFIVADTWGTLDEIIEKSKSVQQPFVEAASERKITVNNLVAYEYIRTLTHSKYASFVSKLEPTHMIKGVCFLDKGKLFDISLIAPKKDYANLLPVFEKSIQTFHIIEINE